MKKSRMELTSDVFICIACLLVSLSITDILPIIFAKIAIIPAVISGIISTKNLIIKIKKR